MTVYSCAKGNNEFEEINNMVSVYVYIVCVMEMFTIKSSINVPLQCLLEMLPRFQT